MKFQELEALFPHHNTQLADAEKAHPFPSCALGSDCDSSRPLETRLLQVIFSQLYLGR